MVYHQDRIMTRTEYVWVARPGARVYHLDPHCRALQGMGIEPVRIKLKRVVNGDHDRQPERKRPCHICAVEP